MNDIRAEKPTHADAPRKKRGGYRGRGKLIHPLKLEMRALARQYGPEVLETLLNIMRDERHDVGARIVAANIILDRGFGKPVPAQPETGDGQVQVNVIPAASALEAARFTSDIASIAARPLLPDGRDVFEEHAAKPVPQSARPVGRAPALEPVQHRLFEGEAEKPSAPDRK